MKVFPLAVLACRGVVARPWTMTMGVLSSCRFDPDDNHFSLCLCNVYVTEPKTSLSDGLHQIVCLLDWYINE